MVNYRKIDNTVRPIILYAFLLTSNFTFIEIDFRPNYYDSTHWLKITELAIFEVLLFLAVWSHMKTMWTEPGYI